MRSDLVSRFVEPVLSLDGDRRVIDVNQAATLELGLTAAALLGSRWPEVMGLAVDADRAEPGRFQAEVSPQQWMQATYFTVGDAAGPSRRIADIPVRCFLDDHEATLVFLEPEDRVASWMQTLNTSNAILPALLAVESAAEAAQLVADAALKASGGDMCRVHLLEGGPILTEVAQSGGLPGDVQPADGGVDSRPVHEEVARYRAPLVAPCRLPASASGGARTTPGWMLCVPLLFEDRVAGTVTVVGRSDAMVVGHTMRSLFPLAGQLSLFLRWASMRPQSPALVMPRMEVHALGSFKISVNGTAVALESFRRKRSLELLKRLLSSKTRSLTRDEIAEEMWPDLNPDAAAANLRVTLHTLRRTLEPDLGPGAPSSFIYADAVRIGLIGETVQVDVDEFMAGHRRLLDLVRLGCSAEALRTGRRIMDLYHGPFLEDEAYSEWCYAQRAGLHEVYLDTVMRVGALLGEARDWHGAAMTYHLAVQAEPAREDAHRALMDAHWRAGRPHAALAQYERCAAALRETLGVQPSARTVALRRGMQDSLDGRRTASAGVSGR